MGMQIGNLFIKIDSRGTELTITQGYALIV